MIAWLPIQAPTAKGKTSTQRNQSGTSSIIALGLTLLSALCACFLSPHHFVWTGAFFCSGPGAWLPPRPEGNGEGVAVEGRAGGLGAGGHLG